MVFLLSFGFLSLLSEDKRCRVEVCADPREDVRWAQKNKLPGGKDFTEQLKTVAREYEDTEFPAIDAANARELLQKIYQNKHVPIKYRMYAASKMVEIEPAPVTVEERNEEVEEAAAFIFKEVGKRRRAMIRERDEQLHRWIGDGSMTEAIALVLRSWWTKKRAPANEDAEFEADDDESMPAWEPMQQNAAPVKVQPQYIAAPMPAPEFTAPEPPQHFNGNGKASHGFVVLFTTPFRAFKVGSRTVYEADSAGEILVDENEVADRDDLIRSGWRTRR
jgi:hypothetical protein